MRVPYCLTEPATYVGAVPVLLAVDAWCSAPRHASAVRKSFLSFYFLDFACAVQPDPMSSVSCAPMWFSSMATSRGLCHWRQDSERMAGGAAHLALQHGVSTVLPLLLLSLILSCSLLYGLKQCSTYLPVAQISLEKNVNRITGGT